MHAKKMRITFYYCIRFKSIKIFVSVQHPAGMGIMQDKMLAFWTNETEKRPAQGRPPFILIVVP